MFPRAAPTGSAGWEFSARETHNERGFVQCAQKQKSFPIQRIYRFPTLLTTKSITHNSLNSI